MFTSEEKRTWWKVLVALLFLFCGFPLLLLVLGMFAFDLAMSLHNLYYLLPAQLFGPDLYPMEDSSIFPTATGYAAAALIYALLAVILSFPGGWLIKNLKESK